MNQKSCLQTACCTLLLTSGLGISVPLAVSADDAAPVTTNAPAGEAAAAATNNPSATESAAAPADQSTNAVPNIAPATPAAIPAAAAATPAAAVPATPITTSPAKAPAAAPEMGPPAYHAINLSAEAGTTGAGGAVVWRFADHVGLVGGMDYFYFSLNKTYSGIPYSGDARLMSERVGLNLYPSAEHSFYVSFGVYLNQNRFDGSATSDGTLEINGFPVPPGDSVHLTYQQQPVDGYVSLGGNLYFDKAHHFSLGTELGAFYLGNPKVSVTTTPPGSVPQSDLDAYKHKVESEIKKLPVWPIIRISLGYSF